MINTDAQANPRYASVTDAPSSQNDARHSVRTTNSPKTTNPPAIWARKNDRASLSCMGNRRRDNAPVKRVAGVTRVDPAIIHQAAPDSDSEPNMAPSPSEPTEPTNSAMVKWTRMG